MSQQNFFSNYDSINYLKQLREQLSTKEILYHIFQKTQMIFIFLIRKINFQLINNSNSNYLMLPRAIQLISIDENRQLKLEDEAAKRIQDFSEQCKNFAVVCVVGKYRTGKSYLINQVLLQQNKGFEVGSTINACTKGLWMWSELIYFESGRSKEPIPAILIDTEGIGSVEEEQNHDVKIFLLAMLMSSYFIYNSVGNIDDMALQNLGLIVNLTKMLQKADESVQKDLFDTFPSFLWILRDFTLRLEDEYGNKITPKEYLENALKPLKGFSEAVENKNKIRRHITQFFQERDCVTLVRPTQDEKDLQHLTTMPFNDLRSEFQEQVLALRKKFSFKVQNKQYKGRPTTPYSFVEMCRHFVKTINEGNLPVIESQWQMICKQEINRTLTGGIQIYSNLMKDLLKGKGLTSEQFDIEHTQFARRVKQYLENNCMDKDSEEFKTAKKLIRQQIDTLSQEAKRSLDQLHLVQLDKIRSQFISELDDDQFDNLNFLDRWEQAQKQIYNLGAKQLLVLEFTNNMQSTVFDILREQFKKLNNNLKNNQASSQQIEELLKENRQKLKQQEDVMFERISQIERERNQSKSELEQEKSKNIRLQQQLISSQSQIDGKVGEYMLKFKQIEKSYNDQLLEKDQNVLQIEQKLKTQQIENEKLKALQKQQEQLSQQEISNMRREIDRLKDEISDKCDIISKLKQSMQEDLSIQYSSHQPRRQKSELNPDFQYQKEFLEFQLVQCQQQLEEQKKLSSELLKGIQGPTDISQLTTNGNMLFFMTLVHQLIGTFIQMQKTTRDDSHYKKYSNILRGLQQYLDEDQVGLILSERQNTKNSETNNLEKTLSSSSPKHSKTSVSNSQNINPFRSPDNYGSKKMTIMQMFMQQKNQQKEQDKVKKSSQVENQFKNRNNLHVSRKIF
ncbi:hypothetical protein pb186bvf_000735 [Paramecium bursaria]